MAKKPFFSIAIPTYNRPEDLKLAVKSFLLQDFTDFEIVISDNSANNESEKICQSFGDKRIKYSRNKANIGFARNLYSVIKKSSGKYVFLLGDDDIVLSADTLSNLYRLLRINHYGYIRLKFYYHKNMDYIFDFNKTSIKNLRKQSSILKTLQFIYKSGFSLISGNIIKNSSDFSIPMIEKSKDPDFLMEGFWVKFIYLQAKKYGAYFDTENVILAKWIIHKKNLAGASENAPGIYDVINNNIYIEKSWNLVFEVLNNKERKTWVRDQIELMIPLLPSVKYYSSNKNLLFYIRRMLELNNDLSKIPSFYLFSIIALLMPKFLWNILRGIVQSYNIVHDQKIDNRLQNLKGKLSIIGVNGKK